MGKIVDRCHQAVQKWTANPSKMSGEQVRTLSKACNYQVPVSSMRPDIFGDLTVQELGYQPRRESAQ